MSINGRAETPQEKRETIERILRAWMQTSHLRLGQLIVNATGPGDGFYIEDQILAELVEAYAYPRRTT